MSFGCRSGLHFRPSVGPWSWKVAVNTNKVRKMECQQCGRVPGPDVRCCYNCNKWCKKHYIHCQCSGPWGGNMVGNKNCTFAWKQRRGANSQTSDQRWRAAMRMVGSAQSNVSIVLTASALLVAGKCDANQGLARQMHVRPNSGYRLELPGRVVPL